MRITNQMMYRLAQSQTMTARDRSVKLQAEVATGMRVVHPGDDPTVAGQMVTQNIAIKRLDTINQSVDRASSELQVADGALQSVGDLLSRANQLAVQMGNDSYSSSERQGAAGEINDIKSQLSRLMNTTVAGRYIFGGNVDNQPPFDAAGNYSGDSGVRQVEVAPGLLGNASVRADQALKGVGIGGVDVFAQLTSLSFALGNNDGAAIRASVSGLSQATDQVASAQTATGAMLAGFESAQQIGSSAKDAAQKVLSASSEADIFEATSSLAMAQQSLEASLAVTAKSFGATLLDYLK